MTEPKEDFRVDLADGKYTYIRYSDGNQKVLRHGTEWSRDITGDGLIAAMGYEIARLRDELERERMRLAACGVVALANTPDSAKEARQMHEDYWSASVSDVARMVDEQIRLRAENAKLRVDADEHDSDCAKHNEPAYPNGPCDCSLAMQKGGGGE